jgi:hypothetical protein
MNREQRQGDMRVRRRANHDSVEALRGQRFVERFETFHAVLLAHLLQQRGVNFTGESLGSFRVEERPEMSLANTAAADHQDVQAHAKCFVPIECMYSETNALKLFPETKTSLAQHKGGKS